MHQTIHLYIKKSMLLKAPLVYEFAPRQPDRQTDEQQYMTVGSCFLSTFLCMGSRHSLLVLPHRPGGDQRGALPYLYPARLPWRPTAAKLKRAPAPPAPPTSSSHAPLNTQALRKPPSLKDRSFKKIWWVLAAQVDVQRGARHPTG